MYIIKIWYQFSHLDILFQDDEDGGEAYDLAKMSRETNSEEPEDEVKVHEIKFDEYGIMDDGLEESTNDQLKNLGKFR